MTIRPVILWGAAAVLGTFLPFVLHWGQVGSSDFDQFAAFHQIALWWHQLGDWTVTWNPFLCGGATLVGNPQVPLLHPNLLFSAIFGPVNGLGVSFAAWMVVGFVGMRWLAAEHGLSELVAAWVATAWVVNGFFVAHLGNLHGTFWAFFALPLVALLHRRIAHDGSPRALAAYPFLLATLGLYNFQFVAYAFPLIGLHFAFELVEAGAAGHGLRAVLRRGLGFGLALGLTLGMMGVYLLPALSWSRDFPRYMPPETVHPIDLLQMLVLPVPLVQFDRDHRAHEYMLTVGPVWVGFALWGARRAWSGRDGAGGAPRARPEAARSLVVLTGLAFLTALGSLEGFGLPAVGPFDALRQLPGYQAIRAPARFMIHGVMGLLIVAGFGWDRWLERRPSRRATTAMVLLALVPLLGVNFWYFQWKLYRSIEGHQERKLAFVADDFSWAPPGRGRQMYAALEPNVGVLDCYDALQTPEAPELRHDVGFAFAGGLPVQVDRISWGEFTITVPSTDPTMEPRTGPRTDTATGAAVVRFNFNHHPGWTVTASEPLGAARVASGFGGPLEVHLEPGATFARIRHHDPSWSLGLALSLVSWLVAAALAARYLWARRASRPALQSR